MTQRERDLRDEVKFHIQSRTERHLQDGMSPSAAAELARRQFGDMEAVMNEMRLARLASSRTTLYAIASASAVVAALWLYAGAAVVFPQPPGVPIRVETRVPPPPPPPPPTWEEFVKKVNTFGVGESKRAGESGKSR